MFVCVLQKFSERQLAAMITGYVLIVASCSAVYCQPFPDWLVTKITTPTELLSVGSGRYRLTNGLISRDFVTTPDFATVDFYSHERKQSLLRAVRWLIYYRHTPVFRLFGTILRFLPLMDKPTLVAEWLMHLAAMCSWAWYAQWPRFDSAQRIISKNSHAHYEQGVNPGQVRGYDGVLCKLWPLLMPWLAASRYQLRCRESRSR